MYHLNTKTGKLGPCNAEKGNCPFGSQENHFETENEGYERIEQRMNLADELDRKFDIADYDDDLDFEVPEYIDKLKKTYPEYSEILSQLDTENNEISMYSRNKDNFIYDRYSPYLPNIKELIKNKYPEFLSTYNEDNEFWHDLKGEPVFEEIWTEYKNAKYSNNKNIKNLETIKSNQFTCIELDNGALLGFYPK